MDLRPYDPADLPGLFEICIRTGDAGRDATRRYPEPHLLARYFAVPYAVFDPRLCLILHDADGPCGYVLGVADTRTYVDWFNACWRPGLEALVQDRPARAEAPEAWLIDLIRRPADVPVWARRYPAHLHIDLLPRAQGCGWGRRMIEAWCTLAAARGARGVHLGVAPENAGAMAFYPRVGFERLRAGTGAVVFARALAVPHSRHG